jgi:hypothetical protein
VIFGTIQSDDSTHNHVNERYRDIAPTIVAVLTLAAGGAGVVIGIPRCPKKKEKHSSQWQATDYGNNACENRMPLDAAKHEIDHGADGKKG